MAQPDYRDGIYDDADNNITGILDTIVGRVPGVVAGYAHDTLKSVIKEFYRRTYAWREFIEIGTLREAQMPYDLNPMNDQSIKVHAVISLTRDGWPLNNLTMGNRTLAYKEVATSATAEPTAFYTNPPSKIHFIHPLPDGGSAANYVATVAVVPLMKTDELPQWCVDNHGEAFIAGTLHKLHNEVKKPYTDPYKAMYHGKEWRYYLADHKIQADKDNGAAEHDWTFPRGTQ